MDLDLPFEFETLKTFFNMWWLFKQKPEVRRSNSGKGFHLLTRGLPIPFGTSLELRQLLGDDEVRVKLDSYMLPKPKQVLWRPEPNHHTQWEEYQYGFPAPFLSYEDTFVQTPRVKRRLKWMRRSKKKLSEDGKMRRISS